MGGHINACCNAKEDEKNNVTLDVSHQPEIAEDIVAG